MIVSANGQVIAESHRAKVMYETRLPPTYYIPEADMVVPVEPAAGHKTFCPFKGTAHYWNIAAGGQTLENVAWSYQTPLPDAEDVGGYIAFADGEATAVDITTNRLKAPHDTNISGPTVDWLIREAWLCKTPEELVDAFCRKLLEDGVSVLRASFFFWSLHPLIVGRHYIWDREADHVVSRTPSYDLLDNPAFANSPLRYVTMGLGGVRQMLTADETEFDFPIMADLKARGATDYVAMPLFFTNGKINVLTLACDHPDGFTTANLGHVFECSTVISRFFEAFSLKENASTLLETYLGRRTGARVLNGEIRRGDGDEIDAAILFCDLRHSTRLSEELGRHAYLDVLNRFFDDVTAAVNRNQGEVLKFIGDAVLAVFPASADPAEACRQALAAACEIEASIGKTALPDRSDSPECAIGIAYGDVAYGNVGSHERLDFTVIGAAANLAARLSDLGKAEGQVITVEDQVAAAWSGKTAEIGEFSLHNVSTPVKAYTVFK